MTELRVDQIEIAVGMILAQIEPHSHNREGLRETPARVAKAYKDMLSGYDYTDEDVATLLKTFLSDCTEMVVFTDVQFTSMCEHHMLPFMGVAHVGYLPNGRIVGASKIPRLITQVYAARLQVQEHMTTQIADAIMKHVLPEGCGVVTKATHLCMSCRGVKQPNASMVCSSLRGAFKKPEVRVEFLNLAHSKV